MTTLTERADYIHDFLVWITDAAAVLERRARKLRPPRVELDMMADELSALLEARGHGKRGCVIIRWVTGTDRYEVLVDLGECCAAVAQACPRGYVQGRWQPIPREDDER